MNHTNWKTNPAFTINCSKLTVPAQICEIFKRFGTDRYIYRIVYKDYIVIKFGMSAAESESRVPGERVYRQIAHCYSWGPARIDGSSGSDWVIIERDFKNKFGIDIDHRDLKITVWDLTTFPFRSFNPTKEILAMEGELINDYINLVGCKPIGNINDEANNRNRSFISKDIWDALIETPIEELLA